MKKLLAEQRLAIVATGSFPPRNEGPEKLAMKAIGILLRVPRASIFQSGERPVSGNLHRLRMRRRLRRADG